jgi:serine/threonine-protein kinase HipA
MRRELEVWLFDIHIGTLSQAEGRLSFLYSKQWLNTAEARPLSQSLPLATKTYNDQESRPFFAGLILQ